MKLTITISALIVATSALANHSNTKDADLPTKATKQYKLGMDSDYDTRVYEFVTDHGMRCVVFFPFGVRSGTWQMQCLPAAQQEQPKK